MRKSALFLMCGALMASAAFASAADASPEDGVMAPAIAMFDLAAPTALAGLDTATIYLDTPRTSSDPLDVPAAAAAMRAVLVVGSTPPSRRAFRRLVGSEIEVLTAEGVPKDG